MKKLISFLLFVASVLSAQTSTPNIGLQIPPTGSNNWYIPLNYNFNKLDQFLSGNLPLPALTVTGPFSAPQFVISGSQITTGLGYTPLNPANNLDEVASPSTALLNLGGIGVNSIKGSWNNGTSYNRSDVVTYSGTTYVSLISGNLNNEPDTSITDWVVLATGGSGNSFNGGTITNALVVSKNGGAQITASNTTDGYGSGFQLSGTGQHNWSILSSGSGNTTPGSLVFYDATIGIGLFAGNTYTDGYNEAWIGMIERGCYGWTLQSNYPDHDSAPYTCLWQTGPQTIAIGNSTYGNASGTLNVANVNATGTSTFGTANVTGVLTVGSCVGCGGGSGGGSNVTDTTIGYFPDTDTAYFGGIASPTGGHTATDVMQATLDAAGCWAANQEKATATVVFADKYPAVVNTLYVPSNVKLVGSGFTDQTWSAQAMLLQQANAGTSGSQTAGQPILAADYTYTTQCPASGGGTVSTNLGGSNSEINGFNLSGFNTYGLLQTGVRVAASNVHVHNVYVTDMDGPAVYHAVGVNNLYEWIYTDSADRFWCGNSTAPSHITGAVDMYALIDGRVINNQLSTGCSFAHNFDANPATYGLYGALAVGGEGNEVFDNLLQVDEIGLLAGGQENRFLSNRVEYTSRENIRNLGLANNFVGNMLTSSCLDPQILPQINSVAAASGGNTVYSGVIKVNGTDATTNQLAGLTVTVGYLAAQNNGTFTVVSNTNSTMTLNNPSGVAQGGTGVYTQIEVAPYQCFSANFSPEEGSSVVVANRLQNEIGVESQVPHQQGSFLWSSVEQSNNDVIAANSYLYDGLPDAYGNGASNQGADFHAQGGPSGLPNVDQTNEFVPNANINAINQVPYVGDFRHILLDETSPIGILSFYGMSDGNTWDVVAVNTTETFYPNTVSSSYRPYSATCDNYPLIMEQGKHYSFTYHNGSVSVTPCNTVSSSVATFGYVGNSAPSAQAQGTVDAFGNGAFRSTVGLSAPTITNNEGSGATDCYKIGIWAGGAYYTSPTTCNNNTATDLTATSPFSANGIYAENTNIPANATKLELWRVSSSGHTGTGIYTPGLVGTLILGPSVLPQMGDNATATITVTTIPPDNINTSGRIVTATSASGSVTHATSCPTASQNDVWVQDGTLNFCWNGVPYIVTATTAP